MSVVLDTNNVYLFNQEIVIPELNNVTQSKQNRKHFLRQIIHSNEKLPNEIPPNENHSIKHSIKHSMKHSEIPPNENKIIPPNEKHLVTNKNGGRSAQEKGQNYEKECQKILMDYGIPHKQNISINSHDLKCIAPWVQFDGQTFCELDFIIPGAIIEVKNCSQINSACIKTIIIQIKKYLSIIPSDYMIYVHNPYFTHATINKILSIIKEDDTLGKYFKGKKISSQIYFIQKLQLVVDGYKDQFLRINPLSTFVSESPPVPIIIADPSVLFTICQYHAKTSPSSRVTHSTLNDFFKLIQLFGNKLYISEYVYKKFFIYTPDEKFLTYLDSYECNVIFDSSFHAFNSIIVYGQETCPLMKDLAQNLFSYFYLPIVCVDLPEKIRHLEGFTKECKKCDKMRIIHDDFDLDQDICRHCIKRFKS
jgi:hypothetical protein